MGETELQFLDVGEGAHRRRIAALTAPARRPDGLGLVWLIGLKSDMASTKAEMLARYAAEQGLAMTRFDYSGHGRSGGRFEEATIGDWVEEAEAVLTQLTRGPQIVLGSSTGAHVALLLLRRMMLQRADEAGRIKGLVLVAPAWDLTEELMWKKFPAEARRAILEQGYYDLPSEYGESYRITRRFIEEGRNHLFAGRPFDPGRPVVILQGVQDVDVPVAHARALTRLLTGGWTELIEIPDGDHRLSRPEDLELLCRTVSVLARRVAD
ncbi:MAG: alpha/beta fold hydrolase [Pseudomonadota bacterium]